MPRKLTAGEKRMVILLVVVVLAFAYYMLFWKNMSEEIDEQQGEILTLETTADNYKARIDQIPELQATLDELLSQANYEDKFYAVDEVQETHLDYLHTLIIDNELELQSIVFSRQEIQLDSISSTQNSLASPGDTPIQPIIPKIIVTGAVVSFNVDFEEPTRIFNMLDTIERSEKMTIANGFSLEIVNVVVDAGNNIRETKKQFKCTASIKFVSLDPDKQDLINTDVPEVTPEETP